jgi:hypothetical protein
VSPPSVVGDFDRELAAQFNAGRKSTMPSEGVKTL